MITVSIITPIYGVEKYIEQCVRSLFEQSYAHIEYIFVNDCTPDKSIDILTEIIPQYPDRAKQVKIIHHEKNKGVGAARQTALMAATGDYIMFADSDDLMPKNAVERLVKKVEDTHADLVEGSFAKYSNGQVGMPQRPKHVSKKSYLRLLICQNIISNGLWGRIYKRSIIMEHQIYFKEGINYAEDILWNAQFMYYATLTSINDVVYYYRIDNLNSYCHDISEKNLQSYFKSTRQLINFLEAHDSQGTYRDAIDIAIVNAYRWAANANVNLSQVDATLSYKPKSRIIKWVIALIKKKVPVKWVNLIYLSYRRIYTTIVCAS